MFNSTTGITQLTEQDLQHYLAIFGVVSLVVIVTVLVAVVAARVSKFFSK